MRVYRPADELFNAATLRSLCNKAITLDQSDKSDPVNARNWKKYAIGHTGDDPREVIRDGEHVQIPLILFDAAAVEAVRSSQARQLSFAYRSKRTVKPGVTENGEPYDAIETDIVFTDHLALVDVARGGETLSIRDATDDCRQLWKARRLCARLRVRQRAEAGRCRAACVDGRAAGMSNAWRLKGEPPPDLADKSARPDLSRTRSLDQLQRAADAAYAAKNRRLDYRTRHHV